MSTTAKFFVGLALALGLGLVVSRNQTVITKSAGKSQVASPVASPISASPIVASNVPDPVSSPSDNQPVIEGDWEMRQKTLRAWAARDPKAALHWLLQRGEEEQGGLAEAVWRGAAAHPRTALALAREIFVTHAAFGELHGSWLATILSEAGETALVLELAAAAPQPGRREWPCAAFAALASREPESARALWDTLPEGPDKNLAWESLASAWAAKDPAALCRHAATLPVGSEQRAAAIFNGAAQWSQSDPMGYQQWLDSTALPEEDRGAPQPLTPEQRAAVQLANEEAVAALDSVADPAQRAALLGAILEDWADTDPEAARLWISRAKWPTAGEQAGYMRATYRLPRPR